jgi:hypothetical protein
MSIFNYSVSIHGGYLRTMRREEYFKRKVVTGGWQKCMWKGFIAKYYWGYWNKEMTGGIIKKHGKGKLRLLVGTFEENRKLLKSKGIGNDNIKTDFRKYRSNSLYSR